MQFNFPTGLTEEGTAFTKVQAISVETHSFHPRTNKRKLRKFLQSAWGIKPQYVKMVLKQMGFWEADRLGESTEVRQLIYKEVEEAWRKEELKSLKTEHRT